MNKILQIKEALHAIPDARSKQGISHPFHGMLALVILGILAGMPYIAHIRRWAKKHWHDLRPTLEFKREKPPAKTTLSRALAQTTIADLQNVFALFMQEVIAEKHDSIVAAVDGKTAKWKCGKSGATSTVPTMFVNG